MKEGEEENKDKIDGEGVRERAGTKERPFGILLHALLFLPSVVSHLLPAVETLDICAFGVEILLGDLFPVSSSKGRDTLSQLRVLLCRPSPTSHMWILPNRGGRPLLLLRGIFLVSISCDTRGGGGGSITPIHTRAKAIDHWTMRDRDGGGDDTGHRGSDAG